MPRCRSAGYHTSLHGLLVGMLHDCDLSDDEVCLNYAHIGAADASACEGGYTFVQSSTGTGGVCVGECNRGDRRTLRQVKGLQYGGTSHDITLPVCIPSRKGAYNAFSQQNIFIFFALLILFSLAWSAAPTSRAWR